MTRSTDRDALPMPDYDHIPLGTLPSRISALDEAGVQQLLDYEEAHGNRLPVAEVLRHRIDALRNGAQPSGAIEQSMPEVAGAPGGGSITPQTAKEPDFPARHGSPFDTEQAR